MRQAHRIRLLPPERDPAPALTLPEPRGRLMEAAEIAEEKYYGKRTARQVKAMLRDLAVPWSKRPLLWWEADVDRRLDASRQGATA